jgi:hypothetical protein
VISTSTESPLALLDLIHVFVESLDYLFEDVCELDLIFNFETLHAVLGEMIVGGVVVETGRERVVEGVKAQGKVAKRPVNERWCWHMGWTINKVECGNYGIETTASHDSPLAGFDTGRSAYATGKFTSCNADESLHPQDGR